MIRHGAAMDRDEFARTGRSDALRPLTSEGRGEMEAIARRLSVEIESLDVLAASPLVRAVQTAEIVAAACGMGAPETTTSLVPEAPPEEFEKWCGALGAKGIVAVVGHEPHLSSLVTWLMTGRRESRVRLRKGGACLLEFESEARRDSGTLSWLLTPRQLAMTSR